MTNSIDQAPQYNPNDDHDVSPTGGERVYTSTGSTPAHPGYEPAPIDRRPSSFLTKNKLIAATAIGSVLVAGAAVFGYKALESGSEKAVKSMMGADRSTSAPAVPGETDPAKMSVDQFDEATRVQQMDYAGTELNQNLREDTDLVRSLLDKAGWGDYNYFNRSVPTPSLDNTPQQIWDQITLGYAHVRNLANQGHVNEAKKLATAVAEGQELSELLESLANGGANNVEVGIGHDDNALPVISNGSYEGVPSNGLGLIEFTKEALATGKFDQVRVVARFTKGNSDNSGRWVLVKTLPIK